MFLCLAFDSSCCSSINKHAKKVVKSCRKWKPGGWIKKKVPILDWLPKYKWSEDLAADLMAGFTVAVMHVPQGKLKLKKTNEKNEIKTHEKS